MTERLSNLDLVRGLAALAVCAGHLRAFLFVDFGQVPPASRGLFHQLFYLSTGLGHQAVMVFFVLSGYLVGGSVLTAHRQGRWSWREYALRRLTRLWVVLLPALLLTLLFDQLGHAISPAGYEGAFATIHSSGPTPALPADWRPATFLGNLFFLQTIIVNCLGTNGPLWSLAYEFWYYALFPLLWHAIHSPDPHHGPHTSSVAVRLMKQAAYAAGAVAVLAWLPSGVVLGGVIWLFGVGAYWLGRLAPVRRVCGHPIWLVGTGALAVASLLISKTTSIFGSDWFIGLAFALWVLGLNSPHREWSWLKGASVALSDMSYTLYVVHFPFLAFVFYVYFGQTQFLPTLPGYGWFVLLLIGMLAFARAIWWCFERNTAIVRRRIELAIPRRWAGTPITPARP
ncbi:MAG TPA: acyltransferase [Vicinamibacterales bacterium]|nr:acyltransferase [Vicinamibacterales bacterium]